MILIAGFFFCLFLLFCLFFVNVERVAKPVIAAIVIVAIVSAILIPIMWLGCTQYDWIGYVPFYCEVI